MPQEDSQKNQHFVKELHIQKNPYHLLRETEAVQNKERTLYSVNYTCGNEAG
jgi:hypothetical protein